MLARKSGAGGDTSWSSWSSITHLSHVGSCCVGARPAGFAPCASKWWSVGYDERGERRTERAISRLEEVRCGRHQVEEPSVSSARLDDHDRADLGAKLRQDADPTGQSVEPEAREQVA